MPAERIISLLTNTPESSLEDLQERVDIIEHKLKFIDKKPTVACLEWLDPLMAAGNWIPELVAIAGGIPVLAEVDGQSAYIEWEDIRETDPEVIVVIARGSSVERTVREIGTLLQLPGFADLQAIKNKRFYIADGDQYFYHTDAGLIDSIEILAEIINPKQFIFGNEGEGWIKFEA